MIEPLFIEFIINSIDADFPAVEIPLGKMGKILYELVRMLVRGLWVRWTAVKPRQAGVHSTLPLSAIISGIWYDESINYGINGDKGGQRS